MLSRRPRRQRSLAFRLRIHALLLLLPLVAVALAVGIGQLVNGGIANDLARTAAAAAQLGPLQDDLQSVATSGLSSLADGGAASPQQFMAAQARVAADLRAWSALPQRSAAEDHILADLQRRWSAAAPDRTAVITAGQAQPPDIGVSHAAAVRLDSDVQGAMADADALEQINTTQLASLQAARAAAEHTALLTTLAALIVGVAAALILSQRLTRSILTPLRALQRGTAAVAAGAFDHPVPVSGDDELSRVGAAFNAMALQVKARQADIRSRERRLSALLANASDGILVITREGSVVYATPSFANAYEPENDRTAGMGELVHPDDRERAARAWARVLAGGLGAGEEVEARIRHRDGTWHHVWARFTNRLDDPDVEGMVLNISDETERHEYEERLTYQALHDPLTGLANRELFRQRLQHEAVAQTPSDTPVSILHLDVDDFKQINDSLGHDAGDQTLTEIARRVVASVRPGDTVARLGGDEFGVLLAPASQHDAVTAAERVIAAVHQPFTAGGRAVSPTVSVGIATARPATMQPDMLLADADLAVYFAKRSGRGRRAVFAPAMRTELVDDLQLGGDLRNAVARGSIEVHYQPIVDLKSGQVVAAEALARWLHPERGWISPTTFIPLAEELGIVEDIDALVLRRACEQGERWRSAGARDLRLAVNLSGRNLQDGGLVRRVKRTLAASGFPAPQLELELTEGVSIAESARTHSLLEALHRLGVKLAIDDFGTGYSALGRLRSLPFDRLKVDKTFVDELNSATGRSTLLAAIVEMAHVLGLEVVAEGVEHPAQAEFLREHGCDFAQGYLFSKPVPPEELTALIEDTAAAAPAGAGTAGRL